MLVLRLKHDGLLALCLLMITLLGQVSLAAGMDLLAVTKDTVISIVPEEGDDPVATFFDINPQGNLFVCPNDEQGIYVYNTTTKQLLQSEVKLPPTMGGAMMNAFMPMAIMLNTRWNPTFSTDGKTVYYPNGSRLVALGDDGKETVLYAASTKEDDEQNNVLSADMLPDGSKCVISVGAPIGMGNFGPMMGVGMPAGPEIYVWMAKTKKAVKLPGDKGVGALWAAGGKVIIYERSSDFTKTGEVWLFDEKMKATRLPVGTANITGGKDNAKLPAAEAPLRFTETYTTSGVRMKVNGNSLLVIRDFRDADAEKQLISKSYAFVVDLTTLKAERIDCLPEKVVRIVAMDVVEGPVLAALCYGNDNTSGIYLIDTVAKQAKRIVSVEDRNVKLNENLVVRAGSIFASYDSTIHQLTLGAPDAKTLTITLKGNLAVGTVVDIFAPELNPITGDVIGADKNAPKGKCRIDSATKATQTANAGDPVEAGDLLVDAKGAIVGEVK